MTTRPAARAARAAGSGIRGAAALKFTRKRFSRLRQVGLQVRAWARGAVNPLPQTVQTRCLSWLLLRFFGRCLVVVIVTLYPTPPSPSIFNLHFTRFPVAYSDSRGHVTLYEQHLSIRPGRDRDCAAAAFSSRAQASFAHGHGSTSGDGDAGQIVSSTGHVQEAWRPLVLRRLPGVAARPPARAGGDQPAAVGSAAVRPPPRARRARRRPAGTAAGPQGRRGLTDAGDRGRAD